MRRIRAIHPSAALFVGILLAFTLPFGFSAEACGSQTQPYRGAELLVGHLEADGDEEYAASVAHRGLVFGWLLFGAGVVGLWGAVRRGGRLWATWCAVTAILSLSFGFVVIDAGDPDIGWALTLFLPTGGVVLKILLALGRWIARRFAPAVTTPDEPAVR
jgi:hypothetical protein